MLTFWVYVKDSCVSIIGCSMIGSWSIVRYFSGLSRHVSILKLSDLSSDLAELLFFWCVLLILILMGVFSSFTPLPLFLLLVYIGSYLFINPIVPFAKLSGKLVLLWKVLFSSLTSNSPFSFFFETTLPRFYILFMNEIVPLFCTLSGLPRFLDGENYF